MVLELPHTRLGLPVGEGVLHRPVIGQKDQLLKKAEWIFGKPLEQLKTEGISPYILSPQRDTTQRIFALAAVTVLAPLIADTLIAASINHRRLAVINVAKEEKGVVTKFQTQVDNSQEIIARLIAETGENYTQLKQRGALKILSNPLDRLLRWLSLDELSQLYDVLNGDSTVVGPRRVAPDEYKKLDVYLGKRRADLYREYVNLRGYGIVSIGQVLDRGMNVEERLAWDVALIENDSFGVEARILSQVPYAVLFDRAAK